MMVHMWRLISGTRPAEISGPFAGYTGFTYPERHGRQESILLVPQNTDKSGECLGEIAFGTHWIDSIDSSFKASVYA